MAEHWRRSALTQQTASELKDGRRYSTRWAIVQEAILAVADADADDDRAYHAARCRFWITLKRLGWTPPTDWSETNAGTGSKVEPLDGPWTEDGGPEARNPEQDDRRHQGSNRRVCR